MQDYDRMQDKQILITHNNKHEKHKQKPDKTQNITKNILRVSDLSSHVATFVKQAPGLHCPYMFAVHGFKSFWV